MHWVFLMCCLQSLCALSHEVSSSARSYGLGEISWAEFTEENELNNHRDPFERGAASEQGRKERNQEGVTVVKC